MIYSNAILDQHQRKLLLEPHQRKLTFIILLVGQEKREKNVHKVYYII